MAERVDALQRVQFGVEAAGSKGVVVPSSKYLGSLTDFGPAVELGIGSDDRPVGSKFAAYVIPGRESVSADFEGQMTYSQIIYLLSSLLKRITPPAPGAQQQVEWVFTVDRWTQEDPVSYTVEYGGADGAERFTYGLVESLTLEFGTEESRLSGTMIGKDYAGGATMTAAPTEPELIPVLPAQVSAFLDTTPGAIGTTRLTRAFNASLSIEEHWGWIWALNAANVRAPAAHVERRPDVSLELGVEADTAGLANLTHARAGATVYIRIEAIGALIGGTDNYRLRLDGAYKISEWGDQEEDQDALLQNVSLIPTWDPTLAYALKIQAQNKIAAL